MRRPRPAQREADAYPRAGTEAAAAKAEAADAQADGGRRAVVDMRRADQRNTACLDPRSIGPDEPL